MTPDEELKLLRADWAALVAQVNQGTYPTFAIWAERDAAGALLRRLNDAIQAERDAAVALLRRLNDAVEALDGTNVENEKLVDDYRALVAQVTGGESRRAAEDDIARKLAAFPDLLEALQAIESMTIEGGHFNKLARAAIAKATGGAA